MPPLSDQNALDEDLLRLNLNQEEHQRKKLSGRRAQAKNKKKHGISSETDEKHSPVYDATQELNPSNPLLPPFLSPTLAPQADLTTNLDPSLESYSDRQSQRTRPTTSEDTTVNWAEEIPYGESPPKSNGLNLAPSPPQYEELRGGFAYASPPISPRAAYRQPIQGSTHYQSFGGYLGASPPGARALSMYSNPAHHPPPPHHPQAHFYGVPDVDFGLNRPFANYDEEEKHGLFVFDCVGVAKLDGTVTHENVLLVSHEHSLDVYQVGRTQLSKIGSLPNLRGSVTAAKILPCLQHGSSTATIEPLVCLVIHGPCIPSSRRFGEKAQDQEECYGPNATLQGPLLLGKELYQTSVEVYSLASGERKATLFRSPEAEEQVSRNRSQPSPLSSMGSVAIQAVGRFITLSSGVSGEVYVFEHSHKAVEDHGQSFRCIGKTWTRISAKRSGNTSTSSRDSTSARQEDSSENILNRPILSLSSRWLATVSPTSSSQISFHGQVPESVGTRIPGVSSHAAPAEPHVTCQMESPETESFVNRMARDATQEFVKGARWVGSQGMQAWNNYWSKPTDANQTNLANSPPNAAQMSASPPAQTFPPTHASSVNPSARVKNQPVIISILDLERLSQGQHLKEAIALQPLATFSLPNGCSMLSFTPSGLQVFTASAKGDVQQVWDLMRIIHGDTRPEVSSISPSSPSVREVARFTRLTEARIIDVVWTKPRGEKLALVTDHGTVHIYALPGSAFYWPPLRRQAQVIKPPPHTNSVEARDHARVHSEPTGTPFSSAFGMFTGNTQPLLSAVRGRTTSASNSFSAFGGFASTAGVGAKSGKAVAAGINRSFTAAASGTVNTIRHLGENRIALPGSPRRSTPGCVRWLDWKEEACLAVTASGVVRIHSIRQSKNPKVGRRRPSAIGSKPVELMIPRSLNHKDAARRSDQVLPRGFFWLPPKANVFPKQESQVVQPLSYAEIETHAPYQPFHTDRRVTCHNYDSDTGQRDPHHLQGDDPWVFGENIRAIRIGPAATAQPDEDMRAGQALPNEMENVVSVEGTEEDGQQIVVTTRRKRARKREEAGVGEDGEFFEDDLEVIDFAQDRV